MNRFVNNNNNNNNSNYYYYHSSYETNRQTMTSAQTDHVINNGCPVDGICRHSSETNHSIAVVSSELLGAAINWRVLPLWALVAAGVTGNTLVCASIVVERKLQNVTNYFLVSLAVADLFVSLFVMPCCIVQEMMGKTACRFSR